MRATVPQLFIETTMFYNETRGGFVSVNVWDSDFHQLMLNIKKKLKTEEQ